MSLNNKKVIVIGGTSGIGLAVAQAAALQGAELAIASSSSTKEVEAKTSIQGKVEGYGLDVTHEQDIEKFFQTIGNFDHLVVSVGRIGFKPFLEESVTEARERFKVLSQEGAIVLVHGRDDERTHQVVKEIKAKSGKAFAVVGNLATDEGAQQVAGQAVTELGGVDILVNNAGIYSNSGWMDTAPDDWGHIYNVNVIAMVRLIRLLVPKMKELGWGRIIQISSAEAMQTFPQMPDYAATKAVNVNMTVSLAKELAGTGITVNVVSPGIIVNDNIKTFFYGVAQERGWGTDWDEIENRVLQEWMSTLTGHLGKVEDVANLVAFLASPVAGYITAANFRVDGGSFF